VNKLFGLFLLAFAFLAPVRAGAQGGMGPGPGMAHSTGGGGCSQATAFLARTSGLDGTHTTAYTNLICGLVTDGLITGTTAGSGSGATACGSKFDAIYILATQDATTAALNLCSTTFSPLSLTGTPTFTTDRGYQATVGTQRLSTGFNASTASSPNYVQNSAHLSLWNNTNASQGQPCIGTAATTLIYPKFTDNNFYGRINESSGAGAVAMTNPTGHLFANRSASNAEQSYQNGASLGSGTQASAAVTNADMTILGNSSGGCTSFQIAAATIGASFSSGEVSSFYTRLRTYMTAVGVP
jgi:hypothetical protein